MSIEKMGWPKGTEEKKLPDGRKFIKLPNPTDMNQFERERIKKDAAKNRIIASSSNDLELAETSSTQSSREMSPINDNNAYLGGYRTQKKYPRRQEEIEKQRREEAVLKKKIQDKLAA